MSKASEARSAKRSNQDRRGALASGADRAGRERTRRNGTPLIAGSRSVTPEPPSGDPSTRQPSTHRPSPTATSGPARKAAAKAGTRRRAATSRTRMSSGRARGPATTTPPAAPPSDRPLHSVPTGPDADGGLPSATAGGEPAPSSAEDTLNLLIGALRMAAVGVGIPAEEIEPRLAQFLAFLRRRIEGDFTVDDFGLDPDFAEHVFFPLLRPIYQHWFRVEVRGVENLPRSGGALIVANHSGTVAIDSLMTQVAVHDEHPDHRYLRPLGADLVFQTPFLGAISRRSGATIAANPDAERLLRDGELVGVWPEGFKGVGKPFKDRYKLQRFGRGGFVSAALRAGVPIVPTSIVGAEEIYPKIGELKTLARVFGLPYFPVTANMVLGPLGLIPLPSKWIIEFGRPVDTDALGPAAAEDPMLVFDLTDRVREQIQQSLYALLMRRRSVFF
ncbi:MAG: lysophospholipid acyltransferase family protein [Nostocoides sp.]